MDSDDDDFFDCGDDESMSAPKISATYNPVNEYLMKEMTELEEKIQSTKMEIEEADRITQSILNRIEKKNTTLNIISSDSENEMYDEEGRPSEKRQRRSLKNSDLVKVKEIWQRIIDDKWIVGVDLENQSHRNLEKLKFHLMIQNEEEPNGIISFWCFSNNMWERVDQIGFRNTDKCTPFSATVVLNIPDFENDQLAKAFGVICYTIYDDQGIKRRLQVPVSDIKLEAFEVADKKFTPKFASNLSQNVLSIKAAGIEKIVDIKLRKDRVKLLNFMEKHGFQEIQAQVYRSRNSEYLRHCLIEFQIYNDADVEVTISARSISMMNIILHMLRQEFPEEMTVTDADILQDATLALGRELGLKLDHRNHKLQEILSAKVVTDLLIPE